MNDQWKDWLDNKIYLLTTPLGVGVGISSLVAGIILGNIIMSIIRN